MATQILNWLKSVLKEFKKQDGVLNKPVLQFFSNKRFQRTDESWVLNAGGMCMMPCDDGSFRILFSNLFLVFLPKTFLKFIILHEKAHIVFEHHKRPALNFMGIAINLNMEFEADLWAAKKLKSRWSGICGLLYTIAVVPILGYAVLSKTINGMFILPFVLICAYFYPTVFLTLTYLPAILVFPRLVNLAFAKLS